jgi:phosphoglycolate phosphatase
VIVIFDMDGTVWDSQPGILACLHHTFRTLGMDVPADQVLSANLGPPLQVMLSELGIPDELVDRATGIYRERYVERGVYEASVYPGVVEVLDELRARGHQLATATSKGEGPTRQMLEHFELTARFDVIGAASMDTSAITKEAVLARALGGLGDPDPSACWMVGDRSYDVVGAASFDIDCIGVTWGYGTEQELLDAGARHVVAEPAELLGILGTTRA